MISRFDRYPVVEVLPAKTGGKIYRLKEPLSYITDIPTTHMIKVPSGFESDGASVPRAFWRLFPPSGQYTAAAILHDWLCIKKPVSSKDAARIFLEAMENLGVPRRVRYPMYWAVRFFGPKF
jgi:hypothetical protein